MILEQKTCGNEPTADTNPPMLNNLGNRNSIVAHPISIFVGIWTFVFFLYSLRLSGQLVYEPGDFFYVYASLIGAFLFGYWYVSVLASAIGRGNASKRPMHVHQTTAATGMNLEDGVMWKRAINLFRIWILLTIAEIIASHGLPIIWLITGSDKSYRDFGIQSLHGFLISMLLACSVVSFYLYLITKRAKYVAIPLFALFWFIVCVTRGFLVGLLLQLLLLRLATKRPTAAQILKIAAAFLILIVAFGILGDFRSGGGDAIRALGQPTERFPDWLPTGFLWVYIYLATPLNNLFNTIQLNPSIDSFTVAGTTSQLFPTFLRNVLFSESSLAQGDLVDAHLNVSTGFIGPYLDMGLIGIVLLSGLLGAISSLFWRQRRTRFFLFGYLFVAQALFLSVFYDVFLYLPCLFQLFWFGYFVRRPASRRALPPLLATPGPNVGTHAL